MKQAAVLRDPLQAVPTGVSVTEQAEDLSVIHRQDCAAAVWTRPSLPSFQSWIDTLDAEKLPRARIILRPDAVQRTVMQLLDSSDIPRCAERNHLTEDIHALAQLFSSIMLAPYIRLRMDVVQTNACRKFHVDALRARLVCTYRGTGTQLGIPDPDGEPQCLLTIATGAPIVLRGTKWPEFPRSGLLHRSPPIEGTGETRLVLVIDPVTDPEMEI